MRSKQYDDIFKLFSFLYVSLTICGIAYNYFFYKQFGINITGYIDFTEALFLFVPLLAQPMVMSGIALLMWHFSIRRFVFGDSDYVFFGSREHTKKILLYILYLWLLCLVIVLAIFFFINSSYIEVVYGLLYIIACFYLPFLLELLFQNMKVGLSNDFKYSFYALLVMLAIVLWTSHTKATRVLNKKDYRPFQVVHQDSSLSFKSDSNIYLLGKTKEYLFIYQFKEKMTRVLKAEDIKEFRIIMK
jgi:hypothetical protein